MHAILKSLSECDPSPLPLSYSKINLLQACPLAWRLKYMDRQKECRSAMLDSQAAQVGKFLHKILEYSVTTGKRYGFDAETVDFNNTWGQVLHSTRITQAEYDRCLEMREQTQSMVERLFSLINKYHLSVTPELQFCMLTDGKVVAMAPWKSRTFTGCLDFWGVTATGKAGILIDYKSHRKSTEKTQATQLQTMLYLYFMFLRFPAVKTIQPGGFFIPEEEYDLGAPVKRDELPAIEKKVRDFVSEFLETYQSTDFSPAISEYCKWCGYIDTCPLKDEIFAQ